MIMWMMIMYTTLATAAVSLLYVSAGVCRFGFIRKLFTNAKYQKAAGVILVFGAFALCGWFLNYINAIVCIIYFALSWLICDLLFWIAEKIRKRLFERYYSGITAIILSIAALGAGWYLDHQVWQTDYNLSTSKKVGDFKIVMFADSHIGTTFNAEGFEKHVRKMQLQNPDIAVIVGDFVDDDTTKQEMLSACRILGNLHTKHGIYFVFGNHDKGYYGAARRGFSAFELVKELQKNGITVLRDENVLIDDKIYIIGRRDYSEIREQSGHRKSMNELTENLDKTKYMLVLDHQPADFANQQTSEVDLVLSGHTHGGQLFPFNQVGKWIGANDMIYGHKKSGKTDFIVTSGISDWAIKFKTGTKSEYVVINIKESK
ncbi:MAG: metallophosphoesterase [Alphaproteobacteria bacterium]|nr:metallophosphoesterase [Alphaproteobacteria bacterium]